MKKIFAILSLLLLSGCAATSVPRMTDPQASIVGIEMTTLAPIGIFSQKPDRVYFVRIDDEKEILQNEIIASNFARDGRIYLLGARPGQYAAVAVYKALSGVPFASAPQPGVSVSVAVGKTGYTTYLSKELIEATKVNAEPGELGFMGSYVVKQSVGLSDAEPIQDHYANLIAPGSPKTGLANLLSGDYQYRGMAVEARRDGNTTSEFLDRAREDLRDGGWGSILK